MRARNLKPSFFKNDLLAELPYEGRLLFAGLWCLADRAGRIEDRPKRIKGELFAFDSVDIEKLLEQLDRHGFIKRYEVDGQRYIWIPAFLKHQHPHHQEKESVLPPHSLDSSAIPSPESPWLDDDAQNENLGFDVDASNKNPEQTRGKPRITPPLHVGQIGLNPESFNLNPESLSKSVVETPKNPAIDLAALWKEFCPGFPQVREISPRRKNLIRQRLKEHPEKSWWEELFSLMNSLPFLQGNNDRGWTATFDWVIANSDNALKVLEGKYYQCQIRSRPTVRLATVEDLQ
ncbi:MAG: hypothetical protein ACYCR5_04585 [Leptospirillum sp.]